HYHAVFHRLPTRDTLYYLGELRALRTSIAAHAPVVLVVAEATILTLGSWIGARQLAPKLASGPRSHLFFGGLSFTLLLGASLLRGERTGGQEEHGVLGPVLSILQPEPAGVAQ